MFNIKINKKILLTQIIFVSIYFYYVYYLQMSDCNCIDKQRSYLIKKLYIIQLILTAFIIITLFKLNKNIYKIVLLILTIITLSIIYNIYKFISNIEQHNCICANTLSKTIIKYNNIYNILLIIYLFINYIQIK